MGKKEVREPLSVRVNVDLGVVVGVEVGTDIGVDGIVRRVGEITRQSVLFLGLNSIALVATPSYRFLIASRKKH